MRPRSHFWLENLHVQPLFFFIGPCSFPRTPAGPEEDGGAVEVGHEAVHGDLLPPHLRRVAEPHRLTHLEVSTELGRGSLLFFKTFFFILMVV